MGKDKNLFWVVVLPVFDFVEHLLNKLLVFGELL